MIPRFVGVVAWLGAAAPLAAQEYVIVTDPLRVARHAVDDAAARFEAEAEGFSHVLDVPPAVALPWIARVGAAHVDVLHAEARLHDAYAAEAERTAARPAAAEVRLDLDGHRARVAGRVDALRAREASLAGRASEDAGAAEQLEVIIRQRAAAEHGLTVLDELATELPDLRRDRAQRAQTLHRTAATDRAIAESHRAEARLWQAYYEALARGVRRTADDH